MDSSTAQPETQQANAIDAKPPAFGRASQDQPVEPPIDVSTPRSVALDKTPKDKPERISPQQWFKEAKEVWAREDGKTWGQPLNCKMLVHGIVKDPKTGKEEYAVYSDRPIDGIKLTPDPETGLLKGKVPDELAEKIRKEKPNEDRGFATTLKSYENLIVIPLSTERTAGGRADLIAHESTHAHDRNTGRNPKRDPKKLEQKLTTNTEEAKEGRYWVDIERQALARGLKTDDPAERKTALQDALAAREYRQNLLGTKEAERAIELSEGKAMFAGRQAGKDIDPNFRDEKHQIRNLEGKVYNYAETGYDTGNAYATLLERSDASWRLLGNLSKESNLGEKARKEYGIPEITIKDVENAVKHGKHDQTYKLDEKVLVRAPEQTPAKPPEKPTNTPARPHGTPQIQASTHTPQRPPAQTPARPAHGTPQRPAGAHTPQRPPARTPSRPTHGMPQRPAGTHTPQRPPARTPARPAHGMPQRPAGAHTPQRPPARTPARPPHGTPRRPAHAPQRAHRPTPRAAMHGTPKAPTRETPARAVPAAAGQVPGGRSVQGTAPPAPASLHTAFLNAGFRPGQGKAGEMLKGLLQAKERTSSVSRNINETDKAPAEGIIAQKAARGGPNQVYNNVKEAAAAGAPPIPSGGAMATLNQQNPPLGGGLGASAKLLDDIVKRINAGGGLEGIGRHIGKMLETLDQIFTSAKSLGGGKDQGAGMQART